MTSTLLALIYLTFISLGLPDGVLGSAWPTIHLSLGVDLSYIGMLSILIACGTILSSFLSYRLTYRFGVGMVTVISVMLTALGLLGFSMSTSFTHLIVWSIPYGLGAGGVDAALNNYVALNYQSKHMNWLHCMWGIGASLGPSIMGFALGHGGSWHTGYFYLFVLQAFLICLLTFTLPLWRKTTNLHQPDTISPTTSHRLTFKEVLHMPGVKQVLITFFCYCALEQTTALWAASYFVFTLGLSPERATAWASLFFIGITFGRALSGFIALRLSNTQMIRGGMGIIFIGIILLLIPSKTIVALFAFVLIGLGCAPIYPCIIHSTPTNFGTEYAQALTGIQIGIAYIGILTMPACFGFLSQFTGVAFLPIFLIFLLVIMYTTFESLISIKRG